MSGSTAASASAAHGVGPHPGRWTGPFFMKKKRIRGCIQDPRPRPNIYRTSSSQPPARGVGGGASTAQRARGQKFQKPQARSHKPEEARRQRSALTAQSNGQNALLINCGWGMEMRKLPCGPRRVVGGSWGAACALHAACCMAVRGPGRWKTPRWRPAPLPFGAAAPAILPPAG
jgi:hypothetical protein